LLGHHMPSWSRVSQIEIPIGPQFRLLTDEEKTKFFVSANDDEKKILVEPIRKAALPLVEPMA
jgi:hypothetical protein